MVAKFRVTRDKETPTAVAVNREEFRACKPDLEESFRWLVGHSISLANPTRPDIPDAVWPVARFYFVPTSVHWKAALHVSMYITFTNAYGIPSQQGKTGVVHFKVYVDSDHAGEATDKRSVSGGVVICSDFCVPCSSRAHKSVTLSSTEAEYAVMAESMLEAIFLQDLWSFVLPDRDVVCTVVIKEANVGAIQLANNPATISNSKQPYTCHHFSRNRVDP